MIKYYKTFFMLKKEDREFKQEKDPLGYVRIEVREGRGRLSCHVSNLKTENLKYKLYIMKVNKQNIVPFCFGCIQLKEGEAELQKKFEPSNVGGTGIPIEYFNVVALVAESLDDDDIICPLAAYKKEKLDWKGKLKNFLSRQKVTKEKDILEKGSLDKKNECDKCENMNKTSEKVKNDSENKIFADKNFKSYKKEVEKSIKFEKEKNDKNVEIKNSSKVMDKSIDSKEKKSETDIKKEGEKSQGIDVKEVFSRLIADFDQSFKKINPFRVERKDYRWWQIVSPVHLNNIFYKLNIRIPILFNPLVMMAHFKYKHIIAGIYEDEKKDLRYVVCGIPGLYRVDEKPFGEMCRWAQVEGEDSQYGAFGYWLVYINPKTGRMLSDD
ncbi:hypothetical protein RBH29_07930 [Herbivorax sp. ANBcel31]|uniref:DUF7922 domain-containing protein n=1 Tax=Herbivorax sp. ANBcel31 TaxID=3069754 RepID=UPI0027B25528|nr:hypothetical protein [Herbivorax sp. ANBcel31]MDQ2086356.1 hypothetical protein [Herbivorax sp. ANBcel31]